MLVNNKRIPPWRCPCAEGNTQICHGLRCFYFPSDGKSGRRVLGYECVAFIPVSGLGLVRLMSERRTRRAGQTAGAQFLLGRRVFA